MRFIVLEYRKTHFPGLSFLKQKYRKMAIFGPITFWISCIYSLERRFIVLENRTTHFPGLYCLKKNKWKNGHLIWPKISILRLFKLSKKNLNFSTFWSSCFYSLERRFIVLKYCKINFPGLYCPNKNDGKMAIFWPKPWVSPFGKISVFRLFEFLVFIA